jgi:hypothetical protein
MKNGSIAGGEKTTVHLPQKYWEMAVMLLMLP